MVIHVSLFEVDVIAIKRSTNKRKKRQLVRERRVPTGCLSPHDLTKRHHMGNKEPSRVGYMETPLDFSLRSVSPSSCSTTEHQIS